MKSYYTIYQVSVEEDFCFMRWDLAKKHGWSFRPYKDVWSGAGEVRDDYDLLNYLYGLLNESHPAGFPGHSMSVSDIVMIRSDDARKYYYCDSFGWQDITDAVIMTK